MALGSCYTCIKYLMFAFNFIFWLLGCAILGVGIWLRVDEQSIEYLHLSEKADVLHTLSYALIVIGFIIMLVGFLGCCGAIRESQCMLAVFFMFLFIIFATLLGFGIWAAVAKDSFKDLARDMLKSATEKYHDPEDTSGKALMDQVQAAYQCCGYELGIQDYQKETQNDDTSSVCPDESKYPGSNKRNCTDPLFTWFKDRLVVVAGIAIGIAVVMILGMIFSMVLCCAIRDSMA